MDREELKKELDKKLWLSAYANNNSRSDFHWQVRVLYDVIVMQDGNDDFYAKVYKELWNENS